MLVKSARQQHCYRDWGLQSLKNLKFKDSYSGENNKKQWWSQDASPRGGDWADLLKYVGGRSHGTKLKNENRTHLYTFFYIYILVLDIFILSIGPIVCRQHYTQEGCGWTWFIARVWVGGWSSKGSFDFAQIQPKCWARCADFKYGLECCLRALD